MKFRSRLSAFICGLTIFLFAPLLARAQTYTDAWLNSINANTQMPCGNYQLSITAQIQASIQQVVNKGGGVVDLTCYTTAITLTADVWSSVTGTPITMVLPAQTITVNANATIPNNWTMVFHQGSSIVAGNSFTLTNNSIDVVAGGRTVTYTSSQTASAQDYGKLVIMNCSSACSYTLPATHPLPHWYIDLVSQGSTVATVALSSSTFNGGSSVPVLISYEPILIYENSASSADYRGEVPLIAGSNITLTPGANGLTISASGSGGSGSVTSVSIGNLSPLFTASVATPTTTPAISFSLSNAPAYTVLTNDTSSSAAAGYGKLDVANVVTGALPIANGGTGETLGSAAFNALSPMNTEGDMIYYHSSFGGVRLPIGSNATCLTSNGSDPNWTSCQITLETNSSNNSNQNLLNFETSTTNAVGLTVTPSNPSGGIEKFEITGSSYTGNAATATALAATPIQCSGVQFATGIAASGNANCATPSIASVAWSQITAPSGNLALSMGSNQTFFTYSFGGGITQALELDNTTAATSSLGASSPNFSLAGQFWDGSASRTETVNIADIIGNGSMPASGVLFDFNYVLGHSNTGLHYIGAPSLLMSTNATFSSLPACASSFTGILVQISDSPSQTWGATVSAGGGSLQAALYCDGTNWTVYAK